MKAASPSSAEFSTYTCYDRRATLGVAALIVLLSLVSLAAPLPSRTPHVADPEFARLRVDPNTATRDELMLLPGIGPVLADNIIACRDAAQAMPAFATPDDLDRVPRIGPLTIEKLRPFLRFPVAAEAGRGAAPP